MWKEFARLWKTSLIVGFIIVPLCLEFVLLAVVSRRQDVNQTSTTTELTTSSIASTSVTKYAISVTSKRRFETFYTESSDVYNPSIHLLWPTGIIVTLKEHNDWLGIEFYANINREYDPMNYSQVSCDLRPVRYNGQLYWMCGTHDLHEPVSCDDIADFCMYVTPPEREEKIAFRVRRKTKVKCYVDSSAQ